jgi:pimeloyl-ACP methyl ester carboxylesterase
VPSLKAFFTQVEPAFEAYASGDHPGALAIFMSVVSGLESTRAAALLEERIPGAVAQAIRDADTFFGVELPALAEWTFGVEEAARLNGPVLSVVGDETQLVWMETAEFLRSSLSHIEESKIDGVGHLLHIQHSEPVAQAMARFLTRNSISGDDPRRLRSDDPAQALITLRA